MQTPFLLPQAWPGTQLDALGLEIAVGKRRECFVASLPFERCQPSYEGQTRCRKAAYHHGCPMAAV